MPKGPKVGMFVRQYEIVCANDAGRAPRKYPEYPVYYVYATLQNNLNAIEVLLMQFRIVCKDLLKQNDFLLLKK